MAINKVLLLLSTTRHSPKSVNLALDTASQEGAQLIILFILDNKLSQSIIEHMTEEGWIGGKPSDSLHAAILKEYFTQGKLKIEEIEREAYSRSISYRSMFCRGEFVEVALKVIQKEAADLIIVTRRRRSNLSRFIFGSAVAELKSKTDCPIMIIDE